MTQQLPLHEAEELYMQAKTGLSQATRTAYRSDIAIIAGHIAEHQGRPVEELTISDVFEVTTLRTAFGLFIHPEGRPRRSKSSVERCWSVWHGFAQFLQAETLIDTNPLPRVDKKIDGEPPLPPKAIERDDIDQLLMQLSLPSDEDPHSWRERDLSIVLLGLLLGLRSAEMIALNIGDFSPVPGQPEARTVLVRGKGKRYRTLTAEPSLVQILEQYLHSRSKRFPDDVPRSRRRRRSVWSQYLPDSPLLVTEPRRTANREASKEPASRLQSDRITRGTLQYRTLRAFKAAGIRPSPGANTHRLRHTFAINLADGNVPVHVITALLGHSTLGTALKYLEASGRHTRDASSDNPLYNLAERAIDRASKAPD